MTSEHDNHRALLADIIRDNPHITDEYRARIEAITERVQPPIKELYGALSRAVGTAQAVSKDAKNTHHGYKYASAEAIIEEANDALSKHGLCVFPVAQRTPDCTTDSATGELMPRRIYTTFRVAHESGEYIDIESSLPVIPDRGRPHDKAELGARTETLGYFLRDLLLLPRVDEKLSVSGRDDQSYAPQRQEQKKEEPRRVPDEIVAQFGEFKGRPHTEWSSSYLCEVIDKLAAGLDDPARAANRAFNLGRLEKLGEALLHRVDKDLCGTPESRVSVLAHYEQQLAGADVPLPARRIYETIIHAVTKYFAPEPTVVLSPSLAAEAKGQP